MNLSNDDYLDWFLLVLGVVLLAITLALLLATYGIWIGTERFGATLLARLTFNNWGSTSKL